MRRMSDTSHLSDTATQPLSRFPATISTASNVIGGAERDQPSHRCRGRRRSRDRRGREYCNWKDDQQNHGCEGAALLT